MPKVNIRMPEREVDQWLNNLSRTNEAESKRLIESTLQSIRARAINNITMAGLVDKGFLRGSVYVRRNPDRLGGAVYTNVNYGPYHEFGTGKYVKVPSYVMDMFGVDSMQWKGRGIRKVNIQPTPFLFASARIGVIEMAAKLKKMGFEEKEGQVGSTGTNSRSIATNRKAAQKRTPVNRMKI